MKDLETARLKQACESLDEAQSFQADVEKNIIGK